MALTASLVFEDPAERRDAQRIPVGSAATARRQATAIDVVILDLSRDGCLIESDAALREGMKISLGIAGIRVRQADVVRRAGREYGCRFPVPLTADEVRRAGKIDTVHTGAFAPQNAPATVSGLNRAGAGINLLLIATVWALAGIVALPFLIVQALIVGIVRKPPGGSSVSPPN